MGYVDPIRLLPPHLQRYAEAARAAGPFIPPRPAVPSDFIIAFDPSEGIGRQRARTVDGIAEIVSRAAGISVIALLGERNFEHYMRARHVVMWLANRETGLSSRRIGRLCGKRDHSTACRAMNRLDRVIAHHGVDVPTDIELAARLLLSLDWPFSLRARRA